MNENIDESDTHGDSSNRNDSVVTTEQVPDRKVGTGEANQIPSDNNVPASAAITRPMLSSTGPGYTRFKAGDMDPQMGVNIREILFVNESCIVYVDEHFSLQWYWNIKLKPDSAGVFKRAAELEARAQFLRHRRNQEDLPSAVRLIGEGVVELFSTQDTAYANAALDTADKFISQRSSEVSRGWYFGPFLGFFLASTVALLLLYALDPSLTKATILACTIAGGMGAFISRALDSGSTPIAATAGRTLHWIEAILRWCIGLTAGLAVWLLVAGNIAGSFLNGVGSDKNTFALIAIALLAGASERLLPSLIKSFDDSIAKKPTPQSATGGKS